MDDRTIKKEEESQDEEEGDDANIELVLPDHNTVIHLPHVRRSKNKRGYSVSFEGKQVIIKRREVLGSGKHRGTIRKINTSRLTETIVISDEDEPVPVVRVD